MVWKENLSSSGESTHQQLDIDRSRLIWIWPHPLPRRRGKPLTALSPDRPSGLQLGKGYMNSGIPNSSATFIVNPITSSETMQLTGGTSSKPPAAHRRFRIPRLFSGGNPSEMALKRKLGRPLAESRLLELSKREKLKWVRTKMT
ncbi:hypothetical protein QN277_027931 [Acacia crassicarpa]|uniref:Uncharacterized protein n=1 Tax=Acacia crassicarpa TaxID=499986 RepID=A0AAE1MJ72_9FABA|nr:hypothetical protein QN277_027931 [Acacia crassicarpa]